MPKKNCRVVFTIPYEDGELKAVSYDETGREIGRQTMVTAKEDTVLKLMPE